MPDIDQIIQAADIIDLRGTTKKDVLRELADVLAERPQITDPRDFLKCIMEREKLISTGIGIGLAMPHVKIASVTDFVLAIGRSTRGIDFDALDGEPVYIVAMIGAAEAQSGDFLKVLAKLVLKLKKKPVRQRVLLARDTESVKNILLEEEE